MPPHSRPRLNLFGIRYRKDMWLSQMGLDENLPDMMMTVTVVRLLLHIHRRLHSFRIRYHKDNLSRQTDFDENL